MKIGVFDSGVGGLTVLKELIHAFPSEKFYFLGDTARLPYGTKSPATIRQYSEQVIDFLIGKDVDAIVIACNTASSQVPESHWKKIPIFNVIGPGAETAVAATKSKRIGVLATRATVQSDSYKNKIKAISNDAEVFSQACPLLVPLAEEGWIDDQVTDLVISRYLAPLVANKIDTLILGCTHFPILKNAIQKASGPNVQLVDSGKAICAKMKSALGLKGASLLPTSGRVKTEVHMYVTDISSQAETLAKRILDPFELARFELVHLKN